MTVAFPFSSEGEFAKAITDIIPKASSYIQRFSAAIAVEFNGVFTLIGTGTYIRINGAVFVLTNHHVAIEGAHKDLLHRPLSSQSWMQFDESYRSSKEYFHTKSPIDLALIPISIIHWEGMPHSGAIVDPGYIQEIVGNSPREMYGFCGYSHQKNLVIQQSDRIHGDISLSTLMEPPADPLIIDGYHICLEHKPDLATHIGPDTVLPVPHGFSGSALWDTKLVASRMSGKTWCPSMMRISGVLILWEPKAMCVVAIRSHFVQHFISRTR